VFYNGWNEERASRLLEQIGLNPDVKLEQLSPGGRMKLGIVSAVAHEPRLLLLDEPTSGLDSLTRFEILRFLSRLAREQQVSVVLSSDVREDLDHITHSVLMLRNGYVVEYAQTTVLNNAD
jgi:ABC-2 type transport system ATP-binding protein